MPILAENKGSNYKVVDAGVYPARCYSMIELGTQTSEFNGEVKVSRQVNITWELPTETAVFHEENGEQPYSVSKNYNLSMHEKSTLRKDLESWRGKGFTEEEAKVFDITKLLGKECQISIIHKTSNDGLKTYANIGTITPVMKGITVPVQINPTRVLCFDNFDFNVFKELPEWLKEKITQSPEFQAIQGYNETMQEQSNQEPDNQGLPF